MVRSRRESGFVHRVGADGIALLYPVRDGLRGELFLRFLESDWKQLGDVRHITYRGRRYRIGDQELDSAGLTRHIYLKSSEEPQR